MTTGFGLHQLPVSRKSDKQVAVSFHKVVRGAGLEPAHPCGRQDLNLVRLPISPPARRKNKRLSLGG